MQLDISVIFKAWQILCILYSQCIGNAVVYPDTLPISLMTYSDSYNSNSIDSLIKRGRICRDIKTEKACKQDWDDILAANLK